ncbi:hypothetical protein CVT26_005073 [Gymnopilus dilepis]|uniref:Uncharacterized protein n=1 Tax=Gymnopilus dilepis TaxID=231916 RepID=A0A409W884_9AGAR|nr:hypothetical protein CVT26_005073 [Gymnopilus dilepis]
MTSPANVPPCYLTHWPDMTLARRESWPSVSRLPGFDSASVQSLPSPWHRPRRDDLQHDPHRAQFVQPPLITKMKKPRLTRTERKLLQHPYHRKDATRPKLRSLFNHDLEHHIFTPVERDLVSKPKRRGIYILSLEEHIDRLHAQLEESDHWEYPVHDLQKYKGIHMQTIKSMLATLEVEGSLRKSKVAEMNVTIEKLKALLSRQSFADTSRHTGNECRDAFYSAR